ncbi:MAG TPA: CPBP family intramembrane glutamic endopeptidase [Vicinamibacterales bacterium]|nr:CPBP family intramembrane glutamic endopeptidase [Vicinamibacterales bacterium]
MRVWAALGRLAFTALAVWAFWVLVDLDVDVFGFATGQGLLKLALWGMPCLFISGYLTHHDGARDPWLELGLTSDPWRGYLLGALATVPMFAAWLLSRQVLSPVDVIFGDAIVSPIAEELLFRGFLFVALRREFSFWGAAAVSSLAFGAAHQGGLTAVLSATAAGMLFAWIVERSRSLWPAIGIHSAINFWWVMSHHGVASERRHIEIEDPAWAIASAFSTVAAILLVEWERRRQTWELQKDS